MRHGAQLRSVRMSGAELAKVSNHSLRAGGATDWSVVMPADFIGAQGGWTSWTYIIYIRPSTQHRRRTAQAMAGAAAVLLRGGHVLCTGDTGTGKSALLMLGLCGKQMGSHGSPAQRVQPPISAWTSKDGVRRDDLVSGLRSIWVSQGRGLAETLPRDSN